MVKVATKRRDHFAPYYAPIGKFSVAFADLETALNAAIRVLLNCTPGQMAAITDRIWSMQRRVILFQTLAGIRLSY